MGELVFLTKTRKSSQRGEGEKKIKNLWHEMKPRSGRSVMTSRKGQGLQIRRRNRTADYGRKFLIVG